MIFKTTLVVYFHEFKTFVLQMLLLAGKLTGKKIPMIWLNNEIEAIVDKRKQNQVKKQQQSNT